MRATSITFPFAYILTMLLIYTVYYCVLWMDSF